MKNRTILACVAACLFVAGCGSDDSSSDNGGDADVTQDASGGADGQAPPADATAFDQSAAVDASGADANADDSAAPDSAVADSAADSAAPMDAGASDSSDGGAASDASTDADADIDCGSPATLHPSAPDAGPYCPFSTAAPPFVTCALGQHCCEPPQGSGTLSTCGADCTGLADGGMDWQCQDPLSCGAGLLCCATATFDANAACGFGVLHAFTTTVCAASCGAGQLRVCESDIECPNGTTCKVVKAKGADFGVCE